MIRVAHLEVEINHGHRIVDNVDSRLNEFPVRAARIEAAPDRLGVDERQHGAVDAIVRSPIWANRHGISVAFLVRNVAALPGDTVEHLADQLAKIGDVDYGAE